MIINPIIYAELSPGYRRIEELESGLEPLNLEREPLSWEAGFLAGHCFLKYRRHGGTKSSPLPDFYIGAHAAVRRLTLLTRDPTRYRHYFPTLKLLTP